MAAEAMAMSGQSPDSGAYEYLLNEAQMILLCMLADSGKGMDVRAEIIAIVKAWGRVAEFSRAQRRRSYGASMMI
jgi:hypothetical protein